MKRNDVHVKICDFGLAKYDTMTTTFLGSMVGTKGYIAPVSGGPKTWLRQVCDLKPSVTGNRRGQLQLDVKS